MKLHEQLFGYIRQNGIFFIMTKIKLSIILQNGEVITLNQLDYLISQNKRINNPLRQKQTMLPKFENDIQ